MPVKAGAKYWVEHLGLGYQQADIRANEYLRAAFRRRGRTVYISYLRYFKPAHCTPWTGRHGQLLFP